MRKTLKYMIATVGILALVSSPAPLHAKKKKSAPPAATAAAAADTLIRKEVEQWPLFRGKPWDPAFRQWVADRLQYPEPLAQQGLGGRVIVRFVLEKDGSINLVEILESPYLLLSAEVIRVLGLSPKWSPARNEKGEPVRLYIIIPVNFTMPVEPRKDRTLPPQLRQGRHAY